MNNAAVLKLPQSKTKATKIEAQINHNCNRNKEQEKEVAHVA